MKDVLTRYPLNVNVLNLKESPTLRIHELSASLKQEGKKIYHFGFGQSPFPVPVPIVEGLRAHAHEKDYLPVKGLLDLRKAIAKHHERVTGATATFNEVLVGPGSKELMFLLQVVYDGDILLPMPSWVSYAPQAKLAYRNLHWLKTTEKERWLISAERLDAFCRITPRGPKLIILNYPSNPAGSTYTRAELIALAEVARKHQILILSDEIYGGVHHEGTHQSVAAYYPEGTIVSGGLSKWCGAGGWRLGTFVFPENLRWLLDAVAIAASESYTSASAPVQHAAIGAFEGGPEIEDYLLKSRRILKTVAQATSQLLSAASLSHPEPEGGFYHFINFENYGESLRKRGITTGEALCEKLLEDTAVALLPASAFGFPDDFFGARLSYVDFDGEKALQLSATQNNPKAEIIAPSVLEGLNEMIDWLKA